jgi:hypothetical protein
MSQPCRGDLVLGSAAPGLGQDGDGDDGADPRCGELVVQGEGAGVAAFGGEQRAGVVHDGEHFTCGEFGLVAGQPGLCRSRVIDADTRSGEVIKLYYKSVGSARDAANQALSEPGQYIELIRRLASDGPASPP